MLKNGRIKLKLFIEIEVQLILIYELSSCPANKLNLICKKNK